MFQPMLGQPLRFCVSFDQCWGNIPVVWLMTLVVPILQTYDLQVY